MVMRLAQDKSTIIFVAIAVVAIAALYYWQGMGQGNPAPGLTQQLCESARGHWNECGSACRGAPEGTACTLQCVPMCMCGGIAGFGCPDGYSCTDYLPSASTPDAMGICKKQ